MKGAKMKDILPISEEEREEWDKLIARSIDVVNSRDKHVFDLIILAGQVEAKYGQNRIGMWADQIGLSWSQAKQYRWLAGKGLDEAFVKRWARTKTKKTGLSFSVIREIASFHGTLVSPYAIESLEWAVEHKATVIAIRAFMHEFTAPHNHKEDTVESFKLALKDKQEHEGFSDFVAQKLVEMVEENPAIEDAILRTAIVGKDDLERLEVAAGISTEEDERIEREAKKVIRKVKAMRDFLADNKKQLTDSIAMSHLHSEEIRDALKYLVDECSALIDVESIDLDEIPSIDIELAS